MTTDLTDFVHVTARQLSNWNGTDFTTGPEPRVTERKLPLQISMNRMNESTLLNKVGNE